MTYLEGADFFVRVVNLPPKVRALVAENEDGTFSMYLNARNDAEQNVESYFHELDHIESDDFYNCRPIRRVEGL